MDTFPPSGWLTQEQAAARLGVKRGLLHKRTWRWRPVLAQHGVRMPKPAGWSCVVYPVELIERIAAERAREAEARSVEGFVTRKQAIAMFRVSEPTWLRWVKQGNIVPRKLPNGGKVTRTLYALADLDRMRQVVRGEDKPHVKEDGSIHVPPGYIRRQTAWAMFGVSKRIWERWENEGVITCGVYIRPWPKLYPVNEIKRLLLEFGRLVPPYPDPQYPGCYRVPLAGRNIRRREALIDADALPLIEGGVCTWSSNVASGSGYVKYTAPGGPCCVPLRRVILGVEEIAPPLEGGERGGGIHIGHANDDPLDCRRENLVIRTGVQRARHRRKNRTYRGQPTTSRFKGVCWVTSLKRWVASIKYQGKTRHLGQFTDELAAAVAYDEAAQQWYGEHARLNFPEGVDAYLQAAGREESETRAAA
jgi:hypothetical protein